MLFLVGICFISSPLHGQEILGDVLSGKLVDPEVGVYAWYTLEDKEEERMFYVRQAIVDRERVGLRRGYWVETEIIPQVGFPAIYKMLLTGPASDPDNVHRILLKEGLQEVQEIDVSALQDSENDEEEAEPTRTLMGTETLDLPQERMEAEHYVLENDDQSTELWVNDAVRPMGIIRMLTDEGELMLLRYGKGGEDGISAFDRDEDMEIQPEDINRTEVDVQNRPQASEDAESEPNTNFRGRTQD